MMYELFLLGLLQGERKMYGYSLQQIMSDATGPFRPIGWGTLYPLIGRLEKDKYIELCAGTSEEKKSKRQRKIYRITERGRERFLKLMLEPGEFNSDYMELMTIKMMCFPHITAAQRLLILHQYEDYVRHVSTHFSRLRRLVVTDERIAEGELVYILAVIDHKLHFSEEDNDWIKHLEQEIVLADPQC